MLKQATVSMIKHKDSEFVVSSNVEMTHFPRYLLEPKYAIFFVK